MCRPRSHELTAPGIFTVEPLVLGAEQTHITSQVPGELRSLSSAKNTPTQTRARQLASDHPAAAASTPPPSRPFLLAACGHASLFISVAVPLPPAPPLANGGQRWRFGKTHAYVWRRELSPHRQARAEMADLSPRGTGTFAGRAGTFRRSGAAAPGGPAQSRFTCLSAVCSLSARWALLSRGG